jgi:L-fuculose-phosphate aldolase
MLLQDERQSVVEYCRKLASTGLTTGTSGNISVFNQQQNLMAVSPSAMSYEVITTKDVVVVDLDANIVDGIRRPSTEFDMHLGCYKARQDIGAIVHTHSIAATTLATLGWDLPAIHYMIAYSGGALVRCAPYRLFGTKDLSDVAVEYLGQSYGCLLASHGVLAGGPNIGHAFALAQQIEFCADLYLRAKSVGEPTILSDEEIADVVASFANYNTQK